MSMLQAQIQQNKYPLGNIESNLMQLQKKGCGKTFYKRNLISSSFKLSKAFHQCSPAFLSLPLCSVAGEFNVSRTSQPPSLMQQQPQHFQSHLSAKNRDRHNCRDGLHTPFLKSLNRNAYWATGKKIPFASGLDTVTTNTFCRLVLILNYKHCRVVAASLHLSPMLSTSTV